ncbi:hypothetical protein [Streptomyces sp. NBC_00582]|uniref:hypothetical protein n=1 Tax=Streptomyces sp. NBC_00582 TaxID=2975783 RepID=UPI002E7FB46C|nr:hypothetical protein [Streptomyces sp. NBC_00582]WUB63225.1 hypothetical protein OG852_23885 [Streptomyces sp. NBC_00582]
MIGRMNRLWPSAAGAGALLAGLSGCADPAVCAGVGVVSQVGVFFVQDGYGDLTGAAYELCTRGKCEQGTLDPERISQIGLPLPDDVDPGSAPVRFRVTRAGAATPVIDESVDVRLLHQSDGCGGGGYARGLAFTREDGLLKTVPKAVWRAWLKQAREPRPPDRTASGTPTG